MGHDLVLQLRLCELVVVTSCSCGNHGWHGQAPPLLLGARGVHLRRLPQLVPGEQYDPQEGAGSRDTSLSALALQFFLSSVMIFLNSFSTSFRMRSPSPRPGILLVVLGPRPVLPPTQESFSALRPSPLVARLRSCWTFVPSWAWRS